jgi:hypothetical protein
MGFPTFAGDLNLGRIVNIMSSWRPVLSDGLARSRILITCDKPLVCVVLRSGLGNRLFQVLAALGYAERTGKQFVFYEKQFLENSHTGPKFTKEVLMALFPSVKFFRGVPPVWNHYYEDSEGFYDGASIPDINGSVMLHGYFQNFGHFPIDSRAKFRIPKPEFCRFNSVDFSNTYFIHFRLGDYEESQYDVGLDFYYKTAIELCKPCKFLIFSDQPDKINLAQFMLTLDDCTIVSKDINVWESLYLMSQCSGGICANSTFSWFGAFYCKGVKIYMPDTWIKNKVSNPVPVWAEGLPLATAVPSVNL